MLAWQETSSGRRFRHASLFAVAAFFVVVLIILTSGTSSIEWRHIVPGNASLAADAQAATHTACPTLAPLQEVEYLPATAPLNPPQLNDEEHKLYKDVLIGLDNRDREVKNDTQLSHLRYAILMPTHRGHFNEAIRWLESFKCLVSDYTDIDIRMIVSDSAEVDELELRLTQESEKLCPERFGPFELPVMNRRRAAPAVTVTNFYDILPESVKDLATPDDTAPILAKFGKYNYQGMKKLQAAVHIDFDWALWLDSEAIVVQPFSAREMFDEFVKEPVYFRSRIGRHDQERQIMQNAALTLGRDIESFGVNIFGIESPQWIFEKDVVADMMLWAAETNGKPDFYDVWLNNPSYSFEMCVLVLHVFARKLETSGGLYAKYKVLETDRELIRYGGAPGFKHVYGLFGSGFFERITLALQTPETLPGLSAMLNRWHVRLLRMDNLVFADAEVIKKCLLDSPIYMLVCGAPDLHAWWAPKVLDPPATGV